MKNIDTWALHKQTAKQTTHDNRYQPRPPQRTGMGLLKQKGGKIK